jgi:cytoskeleton protein RodZ
VLERGSGQTDQGSPIGAILRQTRIALGRSLPEVARDLRIRQVFLEAIETGRYQELPGSAYSLGFIRTYAEHLGLAPDEVVRQFKAEAGGAAPAAKLNFPSPLSEGGVPKGAYLLVGAIIALIGYGIWYITAGRYLDVAELVVPLPEQLRHMLPADDKTPPPPAVSGEQRPSQVNVMIENRGSAPPAAASGAARPAGEPVTPPPGATSIPAPAPAALPPTPPPAPAITSAAPMPPAESPAPPAAAPASAPAAAPAPSPAPVPAGEAAAPPAGGDTGRIVLRALRDSWVQLREADSRRIVLSRTLRAGESLVVPDRPGLMLQTGNAGGLEVAVDGRTLPPLGKPGMVRRDVALDPQQLLATLGEASN